MEGRPVKASFLTLEIGSRPRRRRRRMPRRRLRSVIYTLRPLLVLSLDPLFTEADRDAISAGKKERKEG